MGVSGNTQSFCDLGILTVPGKEKTAIFLPVWNGENNHLVSGTLIMEVQASIGLSTMHWGGKSDILLFLYLFPYP